MPAIYEEALKKEITSKNFSNGYILFGDDSYLKKMYLDKIIDKTCGADSVFDLQIFSNDCNLSNVFDAVMQYPMSAERSCVVLNDYDFEKASKSDFEGLCGLLSELNDGCVFVMRFDAVNFDVKKSAKAKQLISSIEKGGGKAVCLNYRNEAQLAKMLRDGAVKRGCGMDNACANYLVECVGSDINSLKNELDKLCFFVDGGTITKQTVDLVCVKTVESSVYDLAAKILSFNTDGALALLDQLFFMRIEPIIILHSVSSVYVDMYRVSSVLKINGDFEEIKNTFSSYKTRDFVLSRARTNLKNFDSKRLKLSLDALIAADSALKSFSGNERLILEELIVKLCYIANRGVAV